MAMHHSNPKRASEAHALPDVETFEVDARGYAEQIDDADDALSPGWYWHGCFPGCLPDGEQNGPFATEQEAVADAQQDHES